MRTSALLFLALAIVGVPGQFIREDIRFAGGGLHVAMEQADHDPHASGEHEGWIAAQRLAYVAIDSSLRGQKRFDCPLERLDRVRIGCRQRKAASIVQCFHRNDPDPATAQVSSGTGVAAMIRTPRGLLTRRRFVANVSDSEPFLREG